MALLFVDDATTASQRLWAMTSSLDFRHRKRIKLSALRGSMKRVASWKARFRLAILPWQPEDSLEIGTELRERPAFKSLPFLFYKAGKFKAQELASLEVLGLYHVLSGSWSDAELKLQLSFVYELQKKIDFLQISEEHWHETAMLLREMNQQLEALSNVDPLTNLSNRRHFDDVLQVEWKRAMRHGAALSILMIDIDHFKRFNDDYGHLAGDDCLQQVAGALRQQLRRPADLLARYGGEEFIVLLPQTEEAGARVVAESLRKLVESLKIESGGEALKRSVTVSIGVASWTPQKGDRPELLVQAADDALYRAKEGGRNRVESMPVPSKDSR
ncbi:MAG: GGDEF domain-containing protein [Bradymonadales bacterium]|nr:MAG: GGDEF domain-containing protein [Bradymonadales bacterium]